MKKIVFLVSGGGGTLKSIYFAQAFFKDTFQIQGVIADRDCGAYNFAKKEQIPAHRILYQQNQPEEMQKILLDLQPDLIITTIHKIIDKDTLSLFPSAFINLHYSLLPSFGGLIGMKTLDEAWEKNVKFVGATCHQVNEIVDAGKVIMQAAIPVNWSEERFLLENVVFRAACLCLLNSLLILMNQTERAESQIMEYLDKKIIFSPALLFDLALFDTTFWSQLK